MSDNLKIAWITAELAPFVKIGGLADVSAALPKAVARIGHDIRIILPKYGKISDEHNLVSTGISFPDFEGRKCEIYTSNNTEVKLYFIDHPSFGEEAYEGDLGDKFATFCWVASRIFDQVGWHPDIVHANDWHTGLIPPLLKEIPVKTVFTIHNIAYQGEEPVEYVSKIGLNDLVSQKDTVNFMRMGIRHSDLVTTVSETYAKEILTPEYGYGLEQELKDHPENVRGIVHGIDLDEYDPAQDPLIEQNYSIDTLEDKSKNKLHLQQLAKLPQNDEIFTIGMVSRLVEQKGVNLLVDIIPRLVEHNLQVIVLGTGEEDLERELQRLTYAYPEKVGTFLTYNINLSHTIFAGVDAFLVPSKYEPCGLTQLYSMAYGTVPVVRHTGGLADTVYEGGDHPNGFVFHDFESDDLFDAIMRAYRTYHYEANKWKSMQLEGMRRDLSWNKPANEWVALYKEVLG